MVFSDDFISFCLVSVRLGHYTINMESLHILGLSHILFGLLLIGTKKKERADYLLLIWLVVLAMPFLQVFLDKLQGEDIRQIRLNNPAFSLLNGPFLYLYIRELAKGDEISHHYWPHLILFLLYYFCFLINPIVPIPGGPVVELEREKPGILIRYFGAISVLSYGVYIVVSLLLLHKHREFVKECYAYRKGEITLIWIILIPLLFAILILFLILGEKFFAVDILSLHLAVYLVLSLYLIFFGLRQKAVFPRQEKMIKEESKPVEADILEENLEQIIKLMEEGKLYRNPTLSVYDLAVKTGISRHKISTVLKEKLSVNFYQFINDYRLKEVCLRIKEDGENQKNILEHAFDSGFNSKSSFNSLFKMKYDKTPSQYRKSIN